MGAQSSHPTFKPYVGDLGADSKSRARDLVLGRPNQEEERCNALELHGVKLHFTGRFVTSNAEFTSLSEAELSLGDDGTKFLSTLGLGASTNLVSVALHELNLDDTAAALLAEYVRTNTRLVRLVVTSATHRMSPDGLTALATALHHSRAPLRKVFIDGLTTDTTSDDPIPKELVPPRDWQRELGACGC